MKQQEFEAKLKQGLAIGYYVSNKDAAEKDKGAAFVFDPKNNIYFYNDNMSQPDYAFSLSDDSLNQKTIILTDETLENLVAQVNATEHAYFKGIDLNNLPNNLEEWQPNIFAS